MVDKVDQKLKEIILDEMPDHLLRQFFNFTYDDIDKILSTLRRAYILGMDQNKNDDTCCKNVVSGPEEHNYKCATEEDDSDIEILIEELDEDEKAQKEELRGRLEAVLEGFTSMEFVFRPVTELISDNFSTKNFAELVAYLEALAVMGDVKDPDEVVLGWEDAR